MKTHKILAILLKLICGTCTEAHAELETLATLSPQKRAIYSQGEKMLDKLTLMRDSAETVYHNIEQQFAGNGPNAVYTAQRHTLRTLEKIDDNIAAGRALMRMALTGGNATPREFQATALMLINCMENKQLAVDFIETDIDKASPFLYNWLALRAMEAGDNVKAYRYFIKGIRKMAEPAEPVYYPLFHNLGMFLCHSTPYITPEAVRSTQADFDNNRRICVEQYAKAVPFFLKGSTTIYSRAEYLTPHGPYAPSLPGLTNGIVDGLINGTTLAKEYERHNFRIQKATQKSPTSKSTKKKSATQKSRNRS